MSIFREFKITEDFDVDVSELDAAGFNINTEGIAVDAHITTMQTAYQFYEQQLAIYELLEQYAELIEKEASDLRKMAAQTRELDRKIANLIRTVG